MRVITGALLHNEECSVIMVPSLPLEQHRRELNPLKVLSEVVSREREVLRRVAGEVTDNLPRNSGKITPLRQWLRSISHASTW